MKSTHYLKQCIPESIKISISKFIIPFRPFPDFLIIGAMKAGTSSLTHYLLQHPQIIGCHAPDGKEVHYFDGGLGGQDQYLNGTNWYRSHFSLRRRLNPRLKTFEATPFYLFHPLAPERIYKLMPNIKLIVLLRNPTDRAISHFYHKKKRHKEPLQLKEALIQEKKRLKYALKKEDYRSYNFIHYAYKKRGLYKEQLERYREHFSEEQMLILGSEELFSNPEMAVRKVFKFVGVDPKFKINDFNPVNVNTKKANVDPEIYEYLNKYFYPHNQELYKYLGKDFEWDK